MSIYSFVKNTNAMVTMLIDGVVHELNPDNTNIYSFPKTGNDIEIRGNHGGYIFAYTDILPAQASRDIAIAYLRDNFFYPSSSSEGTQDVQLIQNDSVVDAYNPLFVLDGAISANEIDIANSNFVGWQGASGQATNEEFLSLFKSPFSQPITNTTPSPKQIDIAFNLTKGSVIFGFGANTGGTFQDVIVQALGSGGAVRTVMHQQLINNPVTSFTAEIEADLFNQVRIIFNTNEPIALTNITIQKVKFVSSQIRGKSPSGFKNVAITNNSELKVDIARDIFGRVSVADQYSLWDGTSIFDYINQLFYTNYLTGGATITHQKNTSSYVFSVGIGQIAARQLKTRTKYQPLKAHTAAETVLITRAEGVKKWIGYGDLDNYTSAGEATVNGTIQNGVALMVFGQLTYVQLWNNGVQTLDSGDGIERANWNIDKLDGTSTDLNPSGVLLDLNYAQIGIQEMEWLGVGSIIFYVNIQGQNIPIHKVNNANYRTQLVYMRTANLSPFWKIEGVTAGGTLNAICNAVVSGGGHNPIGVPRIAVTTTGNTLSANIAEILLFIRLKPEAYEANVDIIGFGAIVETRSNAEFSICLNPSWTGAALTWVNQPNSHIQIAQGNESILTDVGTQMAFQFVGTEGSVFGQAVSSKLRLGKELQANATNQTSRYDVIALVGKAYTNNEVSRGYINYVDNG